MDRSWIVGTMLFVLIAAGTVCGQEVDQRSFDELFAQVPLDTIGMGPGLTGPHRNTLSIDSATFELRRRCRGSEADLARLAAKLNSGDRDASRRAFYLAKLVGMPAVDLTLAAMRRNNPVEIGKAPNLKALSICIARPNVRLALGDSADRVVDVINKEPLASEHALRLWRLARSDDGVESRFGTDTLIMAQGRLVALKPALMAALVDPQRRSVGLEFRLLVDLAAAARRDMLALHRHRSPRVRADVLLFLQRTQAEGDRVETAITAGLADEVFDVRRIAAETRLLRIAEDTQGEAIFAEVFTDDLPKTERTAGLHQLKSLGVRAGGLIPAAARRLHESIDDSERQQVLAFLTATGRRGAAAESIVRDQLKHDDPSTRLAALMCLHAITADDAEAARLAAAFLGDKLLPLAEQRALIRFLRRAVLSESVVALPALNSVALQMVDRLSAPNLSSAETRLYRAGLREIGFLMEKLGPQALPWLDKLDSASDNELLQGVIARARQRIRK